MKNGEKKKPDVYFDPMARLTPEEKQKLRALITDPTYVKLLRIVEGKKPSSNCANAGSGARDAFSNDRANARLGEIRGWELHIAAIYLVLTDNPQPRVESEPNFPEAGLMNLEPRIPRNQ